LLSDGRPTVGVTNADEIVELSFPYNADGIGLTTIGLGTDFNQELMAGLAERADGNHYFIESGAALDEVFTEELAYFSVAVARDLELSVQIDPNFGIMRAYGAKTFDHTARQGTLDVASVFLAHRRSPDDVTDGDGRRGGGSALLLELMPMPNPDEPATTRVASLALEFTDPELGARVTDELTVEYPFPPSTVLQTGYFENEIVTKSFVMLNIFVGLQQSSDLFHQGRTDDAINMLRRLEAAVEDYNEEVQDTDIALDLEIIEDLRTLMQGLSAPPPPPEIPENPWPAD